MTDHIDQAVEPDIYYDERPTDMQREYYATLTLHPGALAVLHAIACGHTTVAGISRYLVHMRLFRGYYPSPDTVARLMRDIGYDTIKNIINLRDACK